MYVSRSLSPPPDKLMTTTLFFISILSKTEKAWAVSIAGIIPSSLLNSILRIYCLIILNTNINTPV